jgi:excisionase family DNA binding protein
VTAPRRHLTAAPDGNHKSVPRTHPQRTQVRYLTVENIAAELRVSRMAVYRWVDVGDLPAVRIGRLIRVPEIAYEAFIRDHYQGLG